MSDINRIVIVGRLTRDPEVKSTNKGTYISRFTIASNRYVYNKETGEGRNETGFFDCVAFGRTAETIGKYLTKGSRIALDGSLRWSSWETGDGKKNSKVEISADSFQFLDIKSNTESTQQDTTTPAYSGDDEDIPL